MQFVKSGNMPPLFLNVFLFLTRKYRRTGLGCYEKLNTLVFKIGCSRLKLYHHLNKLQIYSKVNTLRL
jgi:hypothetical protein